MISRWSLSGTSSAWPNTSVSLCSWSTPLSVPETVTTSPSRSVPRRVVTLRKRSEVSCVSGGVGVGGGARRGGAGRGCVLGVQLAVQQLGRLPREAGEERAEAIGEGHAGAHQVVDRTAGDVDRIGDEPAGQCQAHRLRDRDAGLLL